MVATAHGGAAFSVLALALAIAAPAAQAVPSTVNADGSGKGPNISYMAFNGNVDMVTVTNAAGAYKFTRTIGTADLQGLGGCSGGPDQVTCASVNISALYANLGDRDDVFTSFIGLEHGINGGAGNDTLNTSASTLADDLVGGPGIDTVTYASRATAVQVTLDGVHDDGGTGEQDNVRADVEHVIGGSGGDTLTGNGAANTLDGAGGDDHLDGGAGPDSLSGGPGADELRARDGEVDAVDCGDGPDTAVVDAVDVVVGCEGVDRPAPSEGPLGAAANPAPAPASAAALPAGAASLAAISARIRARFASGRRTKVRALVLHAPSGALVELRCRGTGCPAKAARRRVGPAGTLDLSALLRTRRLKPGAVVEVRVTQAGFAGRWFRFTVRRGHPPTRAAGVL
jgi:Ca2+-binding RTX toxin-like protein